MAVTQYIGARYVPLFYTNPDDSSNTWKSGIAYDPLTIVTYLNQSYTSKIPVPASVGNPADNSSYWILTGAYNAQVEQYREEVEEYKEDVEHYRQDVANIDTLLASKNVILIGDSFGYGIDGNNNTQYVTGGGWIQRSAAIITNAGGNAYYNTRHYPGLAGFNTTARFEIMFDYLMEDFSVNGDTITDIIVLGGTNDAAVTSGLSTAIQSFITHVKAQCPHAVIKIGSLSSNMYGIKNVIPIYKNAAVTGGVEYLSGLEPLMLNPDYIGNDGIHLTEAGYAYYAPIIFNAIMYNQTDYIEHFDIPLTAASGTTLPADSVLTIFYNKTGFGFQIDGGLGYAGITSAAASGGNTVLATLSKVFHDPNQYRKLYTTIGIPHRATGITPDMIFYLYIDPSDNTLHGVFGGGSTAASMDYLAWALPRTPITHYFY